MTTKTPSRWDASREDVLAELAELVRDLQLCEKEIDSARDLLDCASYRIYHTRNHAVAIRTLIEKNWPEEEENSYEVD